MYVYIQTEFAGRDGAANHLWTVGFYDPEGKFHSDSDHSEKNEAANRVAFLNGIEAIRENYDRRLTAYNSKGERVKVSIPQN